jgi:long-chain alkane monooxygenase
MPKQLHVNVFDMNCVGHITHGMWVHERNNRHRFNDIEFWTELAQIAEHGMLDSIFLADVNGVYDSFRGGSETSVREAVQIPCNDPLMIIPAMAAVTRNLGFGTTFSTTYEPPFAFARRMSTLDHLTKGRIAWNIVTSYLPSAGRNYGLEGQISHDLRYEIADEYLDVCYKLWEGSWDDDAVLRDRQNRVYADAAKVRYINHVGEHFKVAGPHLCEPSRQRTPVLIQATASPAGIACAGRHAEVVFTWGHTRESVRANIASIRASAAAQGRDPSDIKFIVTASIIVGRNDAEVADKVESFRRLQSVEGSLAHLMLGIDLTKYPKTETIGNIIARKDPDWQGIPPFFRQNQTIGEVFEQFIYYSIGVHLVAGTPEIVVKEIERWMDEDGIDGINLLQYLSFDTVRDFVDLVVPELRRRGRFRTSYNDGETLRERLFGAGRARLPGTHFGARYRNPALLSQEARPLRFGGDGNESPLGYMGTR